MIGFPAQKFLLLDQLVLSAKPRLTFRQLIAQAYLQRSILDQFPLAALDGTARRTRKRQSGRQTPATLVGVANLLRNCCLTAHASVCASPSCTKLIHVKYKSEFVHKRRFPCFAPRANARPRCAASEVTRIAALRSDRGWRPSARGNTRRRCRPRRKTKTRRQRRSARSERANRRQARSSRKTRPRR